MLYYRFACSLEAVARLMRLPANFLPQEQIRNIVRAMFPALTIQRARAAAEVASQNGRDALRAAVEAVTGLHPAWPLPLITDAAEVAAYGLPS